MEIPGFLPQVASSSRSSLGSHSQNRLGLFSFNICLDSPLSRPCALYRDTRKSECVSNGRTTSMQTWERGKEKESKGTKRLEESSSTRVSRTVSSPSSQVCPRFCESAVFCASRGSSLMGSRVDCSLGCGINTSNPKPTTSLNELVDLYNRRTGSALAPFTPEVLLALILAKFGTMWETFQVRGFEPFVDSYLRRWIHSCV